MKNRFLINILFSILIVNVSLGQNPKIKNLQKDYDNLSYFKIIDELLPMVIKNNDPSKILIIANSYYFNGQMKESSEWYQKVLSLDSSQLTKEDYFRYVQSLKTIENYSEADKIMRRFIELHPNDSRSKLFKSNYLEIINLASDNYPIKNLNINTSYSDFGASLYQGKLVFASSRNKKEKLYSWNDQPFLDIFEYDSITGVNDIKGKVNTKYHESSTAFSKDGQTMYFTRNNIKKNKNKVIGLKIYRALLKKGKWINVESLPFNSDDYNVAHPALNLDENRLYFTSDMPGTIGGSDIFFVDINSDGSFGTPKNLGNKINTEGRENFPFFSDNGTLYFSSDSHIGLGGLDIFKINDIENISNSKHKVINLGKPINSSRDDFGYIINEASRNGYFTSNRLGGNGDDDIYSFTRNLSIQTVQGSILDINSFKGISNANISFYDKDDNLIDTLKSNDIGMFFKDLPSENDFYKLVGEKDNYENDTIVFVNPSKDSDSLKLLLNPIVKVSDLIVQEKDLVCPFYSIIAGTYSKIENAERKIKSLISEGYDASYTDINPKGLHRVAYGRFKSKNKAIELLYKLRYTSNKEVWFLIEEGTAICEEYELNYILYDFDKSDITNKAEVELKKVIDYMNEYPDVKVVLLSHTDSRGNQSYNMALSNRRNKSASQYLIQEGGIDSRRISFEDLGESKLINECPEGEICNDLHRENRRTEFVFINDLNN